MYRLQMMNFGSWQPQQVQHVSFGKLELLLDSPTTCTAIALGIAQLWPNSQQTKGQKQNQLILRHAL